jgi:hypothetical protein
VLSEGLMTNTAITFFQIPLFKTKQIAFNADLFKRAKKKGIFQPPCHPKDLLKTNNFPPAPTEK